MHIKVVKAYITKRVQAEGAHTFNPSTQEAKTGGVQVWSHKASSKTVKIIERNAVSNKTKHTHKQTNKQMSK